MNKILKIAIIVVLCLIVILTVALVAINNEGKKTTTTTTTTTTTKQDCTEHKDDNTDYLCDVCGAELEKPNPPCTEHKDENGDKVCDVCNEPMPDIDHGNYTATNDTVYVITDHLSIRTSPEVAEDNAVAWVDADAELTRLGYYANGWSKISYEDKEYYVSTDCLTTKKPITSFTDVNETVYFTKNAYIYTRPSYIEGYSKPVDTFYFGESITRTGVATVPFVDEDGKEYIFARVEYTVKVDGVDTPVVYYVNNEYLSTEKPADPDGGIEFEDCDVVLKVIASQSIAIRKSAIWIDGDDEHNTAQIVDYAKTGDTLQTVGKGVESDGTVWYKVVISESTYYVIFNAENLEIVTQGE